MALSESTVKARDFAMDLQVEYVCVCVCVCVSMYMRMYVCTYIRAYVRTCVFIHTYIHNTCIHTYIPQAPLETVLDYLRLQRRPAHPHQRMDEFTLVRSGGIERLLSKVHVCVGGVERRGRGGGGAGFGYWRLENVIQRI